MLERRLARLGAPILNFFTRGSQIAPADQITRQELLHQAGERLNSPTFGHREFKSFIDDLISVTGGDITFGVSRSPDSGPNTLRDRATNTKIILISSDWPSVIASQERDLGTSEGVVNVETLKERLFYKGYYIEPNPNVPKLSSSVTRIVRPQSVGRSYISGEEIFDFTEEIQDLDVDTHEIPDSQARAFLRKVLTFALQ